MRLNRPERVYDPDALEILQQVYDEVCRELGIDPHPVDGALHKEPREELAKAIVDMSAAGLRDPAHVDEPVGSRGPWKRAGHHAPSRCD
jgi:hypothetical protein